MIYLVAVCMSLIAAVASLYFKKASGSDGFLALLTNRNLYIGGFLYVVAALLNVYILRFLDYSVVMPLGSVTYIWTMLLSFFVLKEHMSPKKLFGVACIVLGAVCVTMA